MMKTYKKIERRQSKSHPIVILTTDQMEEIYASFVSVDLNGDGRISKGELIKAAALIGMNPTETDADAMMRLADLDGDGFISFEEYKNVMKKSYISIDIEKERMLTAFRVIDTDHDGFISRAELKTALCHQSSSTTDDVIDSFIDEADINKDGKIDYSEFVISKLCTKVFTER